MHEPLVTAGHIVLRSVHVAVDGDATGAADALSAVGLEGERLVAGVDQLLVERVEQLEDGEVRVHAVDLVRFEGARRLRARLAPNLHCESHR